MRAKTVFESKDTIKGGKGDKLSKEDVCPKQLSIGKKVEKEHSASSKKAKEIALDHLAEDPKYYSKLVEKGLVDEGSAIKEYIKHFGKSKLPKKLQESQNFERGQDPKKSLDLGIKNFFDYVRLRIKEAGLDSSDFWEERYDYAREEDGADILDELYNVLLKTPIDYQISYMKDKVDDFIENNSQLIESQNFERGQDPKKTLNVGLNSDNYVKSKLRERGFTGTKHQDEFWALFSEGFRDMSMDEMGNHVIYILDEGDPKKMMEYMDNELNNYFQMKKEFGETP